MSKPRPTLWGLMVVVFPVASRFAALRHPSELVASGVSTLTVGFLAVAVVVSVIAKGRPRLTCLPFAVFGGLYLCLTLGLFSSHNGFRPPPLLLTTWITSGLNHLGGQLPPPFREAMQLIVDSPIKPTHPDNVVPPPLFNLYKDHGVSYMLAMESFYQIGHSLASLLVGFFAAMLTLVVTGFKRDEVP